MTNTQAPLHQQYELEITDAFKVSRQEDVDSYNAFEKLHNRYLLWHGSRTTNFAGILSQGLRIAPPEAPSTGYMFGKGVYFADTVSKSAECCFASKSNPVGLLLLCEVALGNMYVDALYSLFSYLAISGMRKQNPNLLPNFLLGSTVQKA